jgi:hypothetical protein
MPKLIAAVRCAKKDDQLVSWFLSQPSVTPSSIREWNILAVSLGQKGRPGHATFQIVRWILYPKSILRPVSSIFEAIVQDEGLPMLNQSMKPTTPKEVITKGIATKPSVGLSSSR